MSGRVVFLSFAQGDFSEAGKRIERQAKELGIFDEVIILNETSSRYKLKNFFKDYSSHFLKNKRGFGYWAWKPYICLQVMKNLKENDILVYADSGCELFKKSKLIFKSTIFFAKSRSFFFNTPFSEKYWSKHETSSFFRLKKEDLEQPQKQATFFILRNDKRTKELIKLWYRSSVYNNFSLINDCTKHKNVILKDHRHDQSILSCALKYLKFRSFPWDLHVSNRFYHKKSLIFYLIPIHPLRNRSNLTTPIPEYNYSFSTYLNFLLLLEILRHIFRGLLNKSSFGRRLILLIRGSLGKGVDI